MASLSKSTGKKELDRIAEIRKEVAEATFKDGLGNKILKFGPGLDVETDVTDDRNIMSFFKYRWLPRLQKLKTIEQVKYQVENLRSQVPSLGGTADERLMQKDIDAVIGRLDGGQGSKHSIPKPTSRGMSKSNQQTRNPGTMKVAAPVAKTIVNPGQDHSSKQGTLGNIDPDFIHESTGKTYDQLYKRHRELTHSLATTTGGSHVDLKGIQHHLNSTHDALRDIEQSHGVTPKDRQFATHTKFFGPNIRYFRYHEPTHIEPAFPSHTKKFKGRTSDMVEMGGGKRKTRKRRRKTRKHRRKTKQRRKRKKTRTRKRKPKKKHRRTQRR